MLLCACSRAAETDAASQRGSWKPGEEWQVEEVMRIGSADGEGPDAFAKVVEVALDPTGRVWVADAARHQVQVFDTAGKHVRSIGNKGGGPAEFGSIAGMAWGPNDQLWVLDGANARFAVYDTAGTLVTTRPRNSIMTATPWPGRVDERGRVYDVAAVTRPDGSITPLIVRSDSAGQPRDTFRLPEFTPDVFSITRGDEQNQRTTQVVVPFTGRQAWTIDPGGYVWIANTRRYRIERHAFRGGVERVIERNPPPVPVTPAERSQMLENYRRYEEQGVRIDESRIPRHHPQLGGLLFDDAGQLWVSPVTGTDEGRALDVFDPNALYLGRLRLPVPQRTALKAVRGNRMALVHLDSLDVQTVIVMRIKKP